MRSSMTRVMATGIFVAGLAAETSAQCEGEWRAVPQTERRQVLSVQAWDPDGPGPQEQWLMVGGHFYGLGGVPVWSMAAFDGSGWRPVGTGMGGGTWGFNFVKTMAIHEDELIVAGVFEQVDGVAARQVARFNGTSWNSMGDGLDPTFETGPGGQAPASPINSMVVFNGDLYAAGQFRDGPNSKGNLMRWDGAQWHVVNADHYWIRCLAVYDGELIAAGKFPEIGGIAAEGIARWNGSDWSPLGSGFPGMSWDSSKSIDALSVHGGRLYTAGRFTAVGTTAARNIASWDGQAWTSLDGGLPFAVKSLLSYGPNLIATGELSPSAGQFNGVASWDGETWTPLGPGLVATAGPAYGRALSSCLFRNDLVVGGVFDIAGGIISPSIARWNSRTADIDGDGQVDFADYLEFLSQYEGGDHRVDFNEDGLLDFGDYLEFLNRYDAGC